MRILTTAFLALLLALPGAAGLGQSSQQATRTQTTTGAGATAPTVGATAPEAQDPRFNPNAAGTQMSWRGYGATSGAVSGSTKSAEPPTAQPPAHPRRALRPARRATAR